MTIRITPKAPARTPKKDLASKLAKPKEQLKSAASKFKKDELSLGRGKKLNEQLGKLMKKPPLGQSLSQLLHNQAAAKNVKGSIQELLKMVRFAGPLSKENSPHAGANGQMFAPNGDPLIRVKLSDGPVSGSSQFALVNPKTNEFYVQDNAGGFMHPTTYHGPLSLPPKARFEGDKFTPADLKNLEKIANGEVKPHLPPLAPPLFPQLGKPTLAQLQKLLAAHEKKGDLEYGQPAPKPGNIASETPIKSAHPFTYYAVVLKDDPTHVIIKKVLTGGFVPARPGDGTYSQPISLPLFGAVIG